MQKPYRVLAQSLLVCMLLTGTATVSTSFADEVKTQQSYKTLLTYDDCLALALANDVSLKTLDARIILAQRDLTQANVDASNVQLDRSKSETTYLEEGKKLELYPAIKEKAVADLKASRADQVKAIEKTVMVNYLSIFDKNQSIVSQVNAIALLEKEYASQKIAFSKGKITQLALQDYVVSIEEAKIQLSKLKSDLALAKIQLNKQMGYPLTLDIQAKERPAIDVVKPAYDVEGLAALAAQKSKNVVDAKYTYDQAVKEMTVINKYTLVNRTSAYDTLEKKLPDYKKAYEQAQVDADIQMRTEIINLENAYNDIQVAALRLDMSKQNLDVEKLKLKAGQSTQLAVQKLQNEYDNKKASLDASKVTYYKQKKDFDQTIETLK